jgi:AcrR family transcriptional regulator
VFAEVGFDNSTTIMISAQADTSVGSLYQYFANKEAVLKALVDRYG